VVFGAQRGRTLGFPTANLDPGDLLVPAVGVYAVQATRADGGVYAAAANVGPNPTFGESARKIEVHLLDFSDNLYGEKLRVEFVAKLRETRPFRGPEDLIAQLHQDVATVRALLRG
jgi:riboflavin kinase/FMN adenylyltransferase